ncbi:MAG: type I-C CRISPR-associated protein Cas7/Csd2 [Verrucomicrobia bacterium]|nr:type I-C CRISPR-associated protein Cas7/Csd2 [Verrucomicrobiota bacterium]
MSEEIQLHHNLLGWEFDDQNKRVQNKQGKKASETVKERHDIVLLFGATKCNPNGDPDSGNMPRVQPDSLRGLVTDVCLKRKVRNVFALFYPDGTPIPQDSPAQARYDLFVREGAVFERLLAKNNSLEARAKEIFMGYKVEGLTFDEKSWKLANPAVEKKTRRGKQSEAADGSEGTPEDSKEEAQPKKAGKAVDKRYDEFGERAFRDALCQTYFDVRYFGQVVSTEGPLKGSFYGQIRGPVQFTFAESLDKVLPLDATITRCAVASEKEAEKKDDDNRTMGRKFGVDYGLYRCHIHFSPAFAAKTGFTYYDLDNFFFALTRMFGDYNVDIAAARAGGMRLVGLVDFQHQSALGNAPAHRLFERVNVSGKRVERNPKMLFSRGNDEYSEFPAGLHDYDGEAPEGDLYFNERDGKLIPGKNKEGTSNITARLLVWPERWRRLGPQSGTAS